MKSDRLAEPFSYFRVLLAFAAAIFLLFYLTHTWNPNLMDDVGWLQSNARPHWRQPQEVLDYFVTDIRDDELHSRGRFRPLYVVHQAVLYTIYAHSALAARCIRLLEFILMFFFWTCAFRKDGDVGWWALLLALGSPYLYNSLFYLSVPELQLMLFAGVYVWGAWNPERGRLAAAARWVGLIAGCLSKEPGALYFLGFVTGELFFQPSRQQNRRRIARWVEWLAMIVLLVFISRAGAKGSYTSGVFNLDARRLASFIPYIVVILERGAPLGSLIAGLSFLSFLLWAKSWKTIFSEWLQWSPLGLAALAYFLGLVFWRGGFYLLAPLAPMLSAPLAFVYCRQTRPLLEAHLPLLRRLGEWALIGMVFLTGSFAIGRQFEINREIGTVLGFLQTDLTAIQPRTILYPKRNYLYEQVGAFRVLLNNQGIQTKKANPPVGHLPVLVLYHDVDAPLTEDMMPFVLILNVSHTHRWGIALCKPEIASLCKIF